LLEIEQVPGQGWCCSCRQSVSLSERFAACPVCGDPQVKMTDGGELRLSELEVE
jgi:hydrogenase nickel incorporation protein HypA/HybF